MLRNFIILAAVALVFPTAAFAADAGADMDMGDMADMADMTDMASDMDDMGLDMSDMSDMPNDMPDSGDMTSDLGDMSDMDMQPDLPLPDVRFDGIIELQGTPNWASSLLTLTNDSQGFAATADEDGLFDLYPVPAGTYTLDISHPGFVAQTSEITLTTDSTRRYVLFRDASAPVTLEVIFRDTPTQEVHLMFESERRNFEETLTVDSDRAIWSGDLEADRWTITIEAGEVGEDEDPDDNIPPIFRRKSEYLPTVYHLAVDENERHGQILLYKQALADVNAYDECACRSVSTDRQSSGWAILGLLVGGLVLRRRRSWGSSKT